MSIPAPTPSEGLGRFEEYMPGRVVPESFWTDDKPIGEVIPEQLNAVIHKAIEKVGTDLWRDERLILDGARELYALSTAGVDHDSDVWIVAQGRMFDAVERRYPTLAPRALTENRHVEAERKASSQAGLASMAGQRLDFEGLARAVLSDGGA